MKRNDTQLTKALPLSVLSIIFSFSTAFSESVQANGPWVLDEGERAVGLTFVNETIDVVWTKGDDNKVDPHPELEQSTQWFWYQSGITDKLTLKAQMGYTSAEFAKSVHRFDGFADSAVSLMWQVSNEFEEGSGVTLALKGGAIIRGTYERGFAGSPHAPGDKANGFDLGVTGGRYISDRSSLWAEVGYKVLFNEVPDDLYWGIGTSFFFQSLAVDFNYRGKTALSGIDIMGAGFTGDRFHEVKEARDWLELNVSAGFGGHYIYAGYANVLSGSNTGKSEIANIGYGMAF